MTLFKFSAAARKENVASNVEKQMMRMLVFTWEQ